MTNGMATPAVRYPVWIAGNDILGFGRMAELDLSAADVPNGIWRTQTAERAENRSAGLVQVVPLIEGSARSDAGMARLRSLPPTSPLLSLTSQQIQDEVARILQSRPGDFGAIAAAVALGTTALDDAVVEDVVTQGVERLRTDDGGTPLLTDADAYLVVVRPPLGTRYHMVRVLALAHDDPSLFLERPQPQAGELIFNPGRNLFSDTTIGLSAYLEPLLLARSPWMWGFNATRAGGIVVYSLGTVIAGRRGEAAELLQMSLPPGGMQSGARPTDVSAQTCRAALTWWVERLDGLFSELTEPLNFSDASGRYQPVRHLQVLMGIEQLFRHVQSTLAHDRDRNARRVLLFSALDTLEGLGLCSTEHATTLSHVTTVLEALRQAVPSDAQALLMPNAETAVEALREVQDGFYLRSRVGASAVSVPHADGTTRQVSLEQAAQLWLRLLRNANHGFRPDRQVERNEALLLAHDGTVPEGLPMLSYLFLLHLLADPAARQRMFRSANR